MSKSTDSQPDQRSGDSRLLEFLRRASPILAAERGWNERSRLKIKSLAEDLNLPDDLYDTAVERLQHDDLRFEEQFSAYEQSFIKYLHKQLNKSSNMVLTAAHESKAIRIARREYEIAQSRARQLVRQVAEQLGMSRVSKLDAVEYVAAVIDEQIGDGTIVPDAVRGRIYESSRKWGVEGSQVEILIKNRIEANRQVSISENSRKIRIVAGLMAVVIMLGVFWLVQRFVATSVANARVANAKNDPGESVPVFQPLPRWWATATASAFRDFTANSRAARFPHEILKSDSESDRLDGYRNILKLIQENRGEFSDECVQMFALFFKDESLRVCESMIPMISELGRQPSGPLPNNIRVFADCFRAGDLIRVCLSLPITEDKKTALDEAAFRVTGQTALTTTVNRRIIGFADNYKRSIVANHWRYFATQGFAQPEQAARLIDEFSDLMRTQCPEVNSQEYSTAFNLLAVRPGVWTLMRLTLERAIDNADNDQMRELYLRKNDYDIPELRSWIGKRLANRLEIKTDRLTSTRIDEAIESKLNLTTSRAGGLRPRWQRFNNNATVRRLLNEDLPADPVTIGQAVHFATIAILMSEAQKTGDSRLIAETDALYDEAPSSLAVRSKQLAINLPVYRRIQRRALPSDTRTLATSMEKLSTHRANSDQGNALAFEQLAKSAPRIRDISYQQGLQLAAFILEANRTSELVAVEKFCSQMRHWPNLSLAMADQLRQSKGSIDQALTSTSVLLGITPQISSEDWRQELSEQVLRRVAIGLRHTAEVQGHDQRYQWNELRGQLVDHYRLRCTRVGVPGATISAARTPAELAYLLVEAISDRHQKTLRRLKANQYLSTDELHLFALHGRVLAAELADVPFDDSDNNDETLGKVILDNELAIIRKLARSDR